MDDSTSWKILDAHVRKTWAHQKHDEEWRNLPEIPTKAEIMPKDDEAAEQRIQEENWDDYQNDPIYDPKLPKNLIEGPWPSKEEYISAHYQILREDVVAPLRESVKYFRQHRHMNDDNDTCIYTHVHFKGLNLSPFGAAFKITFSTERAAKQIRWEQSKRLLQGSLVALSPASDMFEKVCKIAVVAARPIAEGLGQNPPMIDLYWGDPSDAVFDPVEPYVMLESRQGYFEAYRHVLVGLQKLRTEQFSLSNHLVDLDLNIGPPKYLKDHSILDLSSLIPSDVAEEWGTEAQDESEFLNVDILKGFPALPRSPMDDSQLSALERMLAKCVAIVQGPPGTGKTFTSVSALKVLLNNLGPNDPPVIIAAQTNHALDQLIKHVQVFEENVVRLGSRTDKANEEITKRTLHELRKSTQDGPNGRRAYKISKMQLDGHIDKIRFLLSPLLTSSGLTEEMLLSHGLITEDQKESLYEPGWYDANQSQREDDPTRTAVSAWVGDGALAPIPRTPQINLGLPLEEADLEFEQLQELEQELEGPEVKEDKERETLWGTRLPFLREFTGKASAAIDDRRVKKTLASNKNLYDIPEAWRGSIYRYWEKQVNKNILEKLKPLLEEYKRITDQGKITKWSYNIKLIRHIGTKLIGCTTTGLSKYRPLLAALQPRVLLIEEAAETLEGYVMAGLFDSLEHLILVGDHKQLQAHCSVKALEGAPYHMGVSLFERLVSNSMGFTMLNTQRRMIPDIRQLLCIDPEPFYENLHDHPFVEDRMVNRAPVPGMGGRDSYFFHHTWPETKGSDLSRLNQDEAEMLVGFFQYLVLNGVKHSQITVLTFYNGQRKAILKELKKHPGLRENTYFNVFTVDSYQGEENDIILLSLVRSNDELGIGFLESRNRLVVALSRARRGLYLFGNAITLTAAETSEIGIGRDVLWTPVINFLRSQGRFDLDGGLPVTCTNHGRTIQVTEADGWLGLAGGCDEECGGVLPCGHDCTLKCHPFDHEMVFCRMPCPKILDCGHGCSHFCGEVCRCSQCEKTSGEVLIRGSTVPIRNFRMDARNTSDLGPPTRPGYSHALVAARLELGAPSQWQNWDAEKADAEAIKKARQRKAKNPGADYSEIVFNDVWRPISRDKLGGKNPVGEERGFLEPKSVITLRPKSTDTLLDAVIATDMTKLELVGGDNVSTIRTSAQKGIDDNSNSDVSKASQNPPASVVPDDLLGPKYDHGILHPPSPYLDPTTPAEADESDDLIDLGGDMNFAPVAAVLDAAKAKQGIDDLLMLD